MLPFRTIAILLFACLQIFPSFASGPDKPPQAQASPAPAGQSTPASAPESESTVLHANANLVLVDVVVSEKGNAVHGLDRRRFHIFEDGKEQTVTSFDEHQPAAVSAAPAKTVALPPFTYTNVPAYPEAPAVNVLLLDALNTPLSDQLEVRRQMILYLGKIPPGTSMAVFTLSSRLRLIEGFTTDVAQLTRAVQNRKGGPQASNVLDSETGNGMDNVIADTATGAAATNPHGGPTARAAMEKMALPYMQQFAAEVIAFQVDERVRMTLDAMQQLARYLSGIRGRKNLIWFSGSFPIALTPDASLISPFSIMRNYEDEIKETSQLLSSARVAVYPVDARGLLSMPSFDASAMGPGRTGLGGTSTGVVNTDPHIPVNTSARFAQQTQAEQAAMKQIAEETGGQAYVDTNGLKEAVESAFNNGASYYTVGYAPSGKLDGLFRKIQLHLDDAGACKLSYRRGYYADSSDKPSTHNPGEPTLMTSATLLGAPPATQILFLARVLPDTAPVFQDAKLPKAPAGDMSATLKGPVHRYIVDLTLEPHSITYVETPDGAHKAGIEFVLAAYDAETTRVNYLDTSVQLNFRDQRFARVMATGIPVRLALDLPLGQISLRIAVHDLSAGRAGSLEIPVAVEPKQESGK
jgi:VWFA-related protein